ncbi:MAG: NAD(P)-dependent oxidoreductase, partial [Chloroflexota bacterium]
TQQWGYHDAPYANDFTVGVLGMGVFGSAAARKLALNGFSVRGWSRTPKTVADVSCFHGAEQFEHFLSACQALVCLLPVTPETEGILCHQTFSMLPTGAYIINVGRGKHLVEQDLLDALASGQIAGACLDVFDVEPLPSEHPFWTHADIIVTPHIAAIGLPDDAADYIAHVLTGIQTGQPLDHVVDRNRGY